MRRPDPGSLTRREQEIAAAYASGRSSREIAEALDIAQSTVKTHLLAVYGKLGVSNKVTFLQTFRPGQPASPRPDVDLRPPLIAVLPPVDATAGPRVGGAVRHALIEALCAYPDVRVTPTTPIQPATLDADFPRIARALGADYLAIPAFGVFSDGFDLLLQLVDRAGIVRSMLRRSLPLDFPRGPVAEAAAAFALQVAGMRGEIVRLERLRRLSRDASPVDAYGLYLAAGELLETQDHDGAELAMALAERAVALDPHFSRGWLMLNWSRHGYASHGWAPSDPPERETAVFRRAAELAPRDALPLGYLALARAKAGAQAEAERLIERAAEQASGFPEAGAELALGMIAVRGEPERALRMTAAALNKCASPPPVWHYMHARAAFFCGDPDQARRASDLAPECVPSLVIRSMAAAELGDRAGARDAWARLVRIAPGFDLRAYARHLPLTHPRARARYAAAGQCLRAAIEP